MSTGGTVSVTSRSAMARNASAAGPPPPSTTGVAGVAAGGDRRLERHLAEQLDADLVGQRLAAARRRTARSVSPWSHVKALMFSITPATRRNDRAGHVGGADGHLLGRHGRRRDDEQIGAGQHAGQAHLHVAGARRHVDEQVVEVRPTPRRAGTARRPWSASGPATSAPCPRRRRGCPCSRPSPGRRRCASRSGRCGSCRRPPWCRPGGPARRACGGPRSPRCRRRARRR